MGGLNAVLEVSELGLCRGEKRLLEGLNFNLYAGQVLVILGPNGAGKSSLLLALNGLINHVEGEIKLQGAALTDFSRLALAREVAWQGDLPPTEFGLTVQQRLDLVSHDSAVDAAVAIAELALENLLPRALGELSAGERQRVELAALMLRTAPVWLLDEPTAHLDLKHQRQCLQMLRREAQQGRAIVVVLHDIQQAQAIAEQVILVDGKGNVAVGNALDMLSQKRLSKLFDTPLIRQGEILLADYMGDSDESER